jgi:hypothetical protein
MEHLIVNKYSDMIAEEVDRYKNEMLDYFRARKVDANKTDEHQSSSSSTYQYFTTSVTRTTYELDGYNKHDSNFTRETSGDNKDQDLRTSPTARSSSDSRTRVKSISYEQEQTQMPTFLTEDSTSYDDKIAIPFHEAFQLPSNLVKSLMFK